MRLENWSVVCDNNPYLAPELRRTSLHGRVYGHPRFEDGTKITTSYIERAVGSRIQTHSGSLYELGEVDPNYEAVYPDAKQKLILSALTNGDPVQ